MGKEIDLSANTARICDIVRERELEQIPKNSNGLPGIYQSSRMGLCSLIISVNRKPTSAILCDFASHFNDFASKQGIVYEIGQESGLAYKLHKRLDTGDTVPAYDIRSTESEIFISGPYCSDKNILLPYFSELNK